MGWSAAQRPYNRIAVINAPRIIDAPTKYRLNKYSLYFAVSTGIYAE
jgi:hypothetical protein